MTLFPFGSLYFYSYFDIVNILSLPKKLYLLFGLGYIIIQHGSNVNSVEEKTENILKGMIK